MTTKKSKQRFHTWENLRKGVEMLADDFPFEREAPDYSTRENILSVDETIKALLEFRKGQSLKDLSIQDMKEEGRR